MTKTKPSKQAPADTDAATRREADAEARESGSDAGDPSAPACDDDETAESGGEEPAHVWTPSLDAPVAIGWTRIGGKAAFRVEVYLTVPEAGASGGVVQDTIVDTTLDAEHAEVPFSVREESGTDDLLRGTLQFDRSEGATRLWVLGLRYRGGYVARHLLA